jgi:hypothetical protein
VPDDSDTQFKQKRVLDWLENFKRIVGRRDRRRAGQRQPADDADYGRLSARAATARDSARWSARGDASGRFQLCAMIRCGVKQQLYTAVKFKCVMPGAPLLSKTPLPTTFPTADLQAIDSARLLKVGGASPTSSRPRSDGRPRQWPVLGSHTFDRIAAARMHGRAIVACWCYDAQQNSRNTSLQLVHAGLQYARRTTAAISVYDTLDYSCLLAARATPTSWDNP